jgi:16S rRNA (cytosine1402-N4)-methyltransferase
MEIEYHVPVLAREVLDYFITDREGIYFDGTLGGAGHAELILNKLKQKAKYIAVDQDQDALIHSKQRLQKYKNIIYKHANFSELGTILEQLHISKVDGLFFDLGVSSHQVDTAKRGFSYMQDVILDMRMNTKSRVTAGNILNSATEDELNQIFYQFGEDKKARAIARRIVAMRQEEDINSTRQLRKAIDEVVHYRYTIKSYARIFQALRITVNNELENLKKALIDSIQFLKQGGRLVIISYHSLEDRIVKNFLKEKANPCTCPPELPVCVCGLKPEIKILTRKVIRPGKKEIQKNPRSRSALLRVGERL